MQKSFLKNEREKDLVEICWKSTCIRRETGSHTRMKEEKSKKIKQMVGTIEMNYDHEIICVC